MDLSSDLHHEILSQNKIVKVKMDIRFQPGDNEALTAWNIFYDA